MIVTGAMLEPAVVLAGCDVTARCVAAADRAVAENVAEDPGIDPVDAVTVWDPTVLPSVHVVCAKPDEFVTALALPTEPPPLATAKVTVIPLTPSPSAAVTIATSGPGSVAPTIALCPEPELAAIAVGGGMTVSVA
jgi:hypothetical protein